MKLLKIDDFAVFSYELYNLIRIVIKQNSFQIDEFESIDVCL